MIKELPEGQTNYDPKAELEARIDNFVRDVCSVGVKPKSEIRRRLINLINSAIEYEK